MRFTSSSRSRRSRSTNSSPQPTQHGDSGQPPRSINEQDLISALASGSIAAAGLDVFEKEPVTNELIGMDNVTLSPHCLSWTDEMSLGNGSSCVRAIVAVANGRTP